MWRYRYRRDYIPDEELIDRCNVLGQEGWSIVGPPRWAPPDFWENGQQRTSGVWVCFFKRTVSNREQLAEVFSLAPRGRPELQP